MNEFTLAQKEEQLIKSDFRKQTHIEGGQVITTWYGPAGQIWQGVRATESIWCEYFNPLHVAMRCACYQNPIADAMRANQEAERCSTKKDNKHV